MAKSFYLRIGSNSEKKYAEKLGGTFSGIISRANFFEMSSGLLSGLFLNFTSNNNAFGHIIDPVTYVYALNPYNDWSIRSWQKVKKDAAESKLRSDLRLGASETIDSSWIKEIENPTERQKDKVQVYGVNKAYRALADIYFPKSLANRIGKYALEPSDFDDQTIDAVISRVSGYQTGAISSKYAAKKFADFTGGLPEPAFILAPYFYIKSAEWLKLNQKIWARLGALIKTNKSALVLHCENDFFCENVTEILSSMVKAGPRNVFIWLDGFTEDSASDTQLTAYAKFVTGLSTSGINTFSLYSGGFSLFMLAYGLSGIVTGPGYGMQKDTEPVKGGVPTAKFYMPNRYTREQVLASYDLLERKDLGSSKDKFIAEVCACPICKKGLKEFGNDRSFMLQYYGELAEQDEENPEKRRLPSQNALERCNFHFLFARLIEYRWALKADKDAAIARLNSNIQKWGDGNHLATWKSVLSKF